MVIVNSSSENVSEEELKEDLGILKYLLIRLLIENNGSLKINAITDETYNEDLEITFDVEDLIPNRPLVIKLRRNGKEITEEDIEDIKIPNFLRNVQKEIEEQLSVLKQGDIMVKELKGKK